MDEYIRHQDRFNPDEFYQQVHVIGCGGMGSRVAEGLARLGVGSNGFSGINLYDDDYFDPHNVANQWLDWSDVGSAKAEVVAHNIHRINPRLLVDCRVEAVTDVSRFKGLLFLCLDSMNARRQIVDSLTDTSSVTCIIETRMDAGAGISHCFDPRDPKQLACWKSHWFSDKEADDMIGCANPQSIISAIYGTTALALKHFEQYAFFRTAPDRANRVYQDFDHQFLVTEDWPRLD